MSGPYGHAGLTRLTGWDDIGYRCRIRLSAGRAEICLWPSGQEWEHAPAVRGAARPGEAPEFHPPLHGPRDSPLRQAARRSLEALESMRGWGVGTPLMGVMPSPVPRPVMADPRAPLAERSPKAESPARCSGGTACVWRNSAL